MNIPVALNAVNANDIRKVKKIIRHDRTMKINIKDNDTNTPLIIASREGYSGIVKVLISAGADLEAKGLFMDTKGISALSVSILAMKPEIAKILIIAGANINAEDEEDMDTPLHEVCYRGYPGIAQMLIERGADVNHQNRFSHAPLGTAANYGHIEIIKNLLTAGANINYDNDGWGIALLSAANGRVDSEELITTLVNAGSNINMQGIFDDTALIMAANRGKIITVKALLRLGADKSVKDFKGRTAYDIAIEKGHLEVANLLEL